MHKVKVYSRETIIDYVRSDPANKCRPLYKYGMCKHYIVEKTGYQTAVFTYYTSVDGVSYYTLRRWNVTPKKYAVGMWY